MKLIFALSLLIGLSAQAAEFDITVNKAGQVVTSSVPSCPAGTILADGQAISRTDYAKLFAIMGTGYGTGNGTDTFNLPDYRGLFLRSGSSVNDPDFAARTSGGVFPNSTNDTKIGSVQLDQNRAHTHQTAGTVMGGVSGNQYGGYAGGLTAGGLSDIAYTGPGGGHMYAPNTPGAEWISRPSGGSESRPINAAVTFCIAY